MEALRQLVAQFTVQVDPEGNLDKGNRKIDALRDKMRGLNTSFRAPGSRFSAGVGVNAAGGLRGAFRGTAPLSDGLAATASVGGIGGAARGALGMVTSLRAGLIGLAGGVVIGAVTQVIDKIGGIGEEASKLGVTNAEFQRLDVLAKQNATSVGALGTAFRTLATNAVDPSKDAADAFKRLGVETKDGNGALKSRQDLFFETATALADVSNTTTRAALAQKIYGRSALEIAPLLAAGRDGIEAQRAELEKMPVVTDSAIEAADRLSDRWATIGPRLTAMAAPVIEKIIPIFETLTVWFIKATDAVTKLVTESRLLDHLSAIGKTLSTTWRVMGGAVGRLFETFGGKLPSVNRMLSVMVDLIGRAGLAFATLIQFPALLAEDFQVYMRGGDSVIGRAINALTGLFDSAAEAARNAFSNLFDWIGEQLKALPGRLASAITPEFAAGVDFAAGPGGMLGMPIPLPPPMPTSAGASVVDQSTKSVTVNMLPSSSPDQVASKVGAVLAKDRNAVAAGVP